MAKKPWGVLVYMVADHNAGGLKLDPLADRELVALQQAADATGMDVALQIDYNRRNAETVRQWIGPNAGLKGLVKFKRIPARRHTITRKFLDKGGFVDVKVELGEEANAASPYVLKQFLRWGRGQCDADRYAIVFWGHSSGPGGLFFDNEPRSSHAKTLDPIEIAKAVDAADIVLFRDCCMSTLEIAYELQGVAKFAIASQAIDPVRPPWPWIDLFAVLQTLSTDNDAAVARALTVRIGTFYDLASNRAGFEDVPYTLLDLRQIGRMTEPLQLLVRRLEEMRDDAAVAVARRAFESARLGFPNSGSNPGDPALVDIPSVCASLKISGITELAAAASGVADAWAHVRRYHRARKPQFNGISAYYETVSLRARNESFVEPVNPSLYRDLALTRATQWSTLALNPLSRVSTKSPKGPPRKR